MVNRAAPLLLPLLLPSLLALLLLSSCAPPIVPTADSLAIATRIEGAVRIEDPSGSLEPGGEAFVFRYDCAAPPPPVGTGRPVDFLVLPRERFVNGRADFVFPSVRPATCSILTGFFDRDGDFNPFVTIGNQATAGDLAMTPVTVSTEALAEGSAAVPPVTGVVLRAGTIVPLDRPAFVVTDRATGLPGGELLVGPAVGTTANTYLRLSTTAVSSELTDVEAPVFTLVFAPDGDANGWPDDLNADGLPDVLWPRVLFLRLNDADPTGRTVLSPPLILPGVVLPLDPDDAIDLTTNRVLQSRLAGLPFDGAQVVPVTDLLVAVPPLVLTDLASRSTAPIEEQRDGGVNVLGGYQILVMNSTGQTWPLPNELAEDRADQGARFVARTPEEPLPPRTLLAGTVTVLDPEGPGGDALVTLFDCAAPPPPVGTGSPIDLAVVKAASFVDGVGAFAFGTVPAQACVIVTGYVDRDQDFNPFATITKLPTRGDLLLSAQVVQVEAAGPNGLVTPVLDVALSGTTVVPLDAPAFVAAAEDGGVAVMTRSAQVGATETVTLSISAADHASALTTSEDPFFTLVFGPDADADGLPDDANGDGLPDVLWPRVLLLRLDPDDPEGVDFTDPKIVLPGIVVPLDLSNPPDLGTNRVLQAALDGLPFDGAFVIPVTTLTVAVPGLVVTDLATQTVAPIESVAASGVTVDGDYAVLVMNSSGQTWQVPNESLLFGDSTQGVALRVEPPDEEAAPTGSIEGSITVADGSDPGGRTVLFRFDCANPPPPTGSGRPVDFALFDEGDWTADELPFRFAGLPAGTCQLLTGFVDRDGDWSGLYSTNNQATAGDVVIVPRGVMVPAVDGATGLVPEVVNQDLSAAVVVPLERPVFTMVDVASGGTSAPTMTVGAAPGDTASVFLRLSTTSIEAPVCSASSPLFTLIFAPDGNSDGAPDDNNGDGLPDVLWPKVLIRKLDANDPAGIAAQATAPVVLPGIVVPLDPADPFDPGTNLVIQHALAGLAFNGTSVFPQAALTVAVPGLVVTDFAALTVAPIEEVASSQEVAGEYQVLVMNSSGQTWQLPNEALLFAVEGQEAVFVVE